ncbi:HNH endonuclease [bacterium]|nr:HNH endonuclease [bacterium]
MRTCPKCEICKPITIEYFKPNRTRPNGWEVWCRECFNAYCRARTKARPDLRREKERRFAERHPEKYAAKIKQHRERTKERGGNKYAKRNIEKTRLRERLRWLDPERQAYDRARWERRKANGYNEHEQERYKQNPWPKRLKELRHRTLELSAPGIFAQEDLLAKVQYWGWRCRYCNIRLTFATLTIDHRIPLSRGGSNWLANLVPACRSCNSSKHNKKEDEYFEWLKND